MLSGPSTNDVLVIGRDLIFDRAKFERLSSSKLQPDKKLLSWFYLLTPFESSFLLIWLFRKFLEFKNNLNRVLLYLYSAFKIMLKSSDFTRLIGLSRFARLNFQI